VAGLAKPLIVVGLLLVALGVYLALGGRLPPLGRLPGDIVVRRGGVTIWVPITTMLLASLVMSALLWALARVR
jgi:hypothetical protein